MAKRTAATTAAMATTGNRVQQAIDFMQNRLDAMNGVAMNGMPLSELEKGQRLDLTEWTAFQNTQTQAHASGKITADEARTIYSYLGGESYNERRGGWSAAAGLAEKITIIRLMAELMGVK